MSVTTMSGSSRACRRAASGVADGRDHLVPGPFEDADQPLAQQGGVLGELSILSTALHPHLGRPTGRLVTTSEPPSA